MRSLAVPPPAMAGACGVLLAAAAATGGSPGDAGRGLPEVVFVSRQPVAAEPGAIPGLGPHHRTVVTRGRLLLREAGGRVRELLPRDAFLDVSDPSVSCDGRRVAFAAVAREGERWRLWTVGLDGRGLRPVVADGPGADGPAGPPPPASERAFDDLDPCWVDDSTLVFASTRDGLRAQYADLPVTNLFTVTVGPAAGGTRPCRRLTAERNGAEEPAMDWGTGRVVFARWWFNRHRAADTAEGITTEADLAIPRDTVNLWQAMELSPADRRPRLAAADLATRRASMGYQPAVQADGSIVAVYAGNLGLSPGPAGTGVHRLPRGVRGPARRLAGALVAGRAGDAYGEARGLAPSSACAPTALPDGRVLFSYDPGARGDFGLYVIRPDGSGLERVLDLPGTLELDAAPVVRRRAPPRAGAAGADHAEGGSGATFRYHDLDVFADGPPGSPVRGAAARTPGARIRFFASLPRPDRPGGDTAVLVREMPVGADGEVDARGLPAGLPMFEQLVGPDGRVLRTAHGPAHVAGHNTGVPGTVSRCVGCHLGHSTLPAEPAAGPKAGS